VTDALLAVVVIVLLAQVALVGWLIRRGYLIWRVLLGKGRVPMKCGPVLRVPAAQR